MIIRQGAQNHSQPIFLNHPIEYATLILEGRIDNLFNVSMLGRGTKIQSLSPLYTHLQSTGRLQFYQVYAHPSNTSPPHLDLSLSGIQFHFELSLYGVYSHSVRRSMKLLELFGILFQEATFPHGSLFFSMQEIPSKCLIGTHYDKGLI